MSHFPDVTTLALFGGHRRFLRDPADDARASYLEATRERLLDGDLALELPEDLARELLQQVICTLYPKRILDSRDDYQDVIVKARDHIEAYARDRACELADAYLEAACRG